MSNFHDCEQDKLRGEGKAFIPLSNEHFLRGLVDVNRDMVDFIQKRNPQKVATLDQDATLVATAKIDALFSYKGFRSYQPVNTEAIQDSALPGYFRGRSVAPVVVNLKVVKPTNRVVFRGTRTDNLTESREEAW